MTILETPRSLDYFILRLCERLHLTEQQFLDTPYPHQLRLLSYELLRQLEDSPTHSPLTTPHSPLP